MLPKHALHLKLSKDKKTFTGQLSEWEVNVVSRMRRIWVGKIKFLPPLQADYTEYQSQETFESKMALDALLKAEGLPTLIGILDSTQNHLSFLDIYSIPVTWESPPLSAASRLSMRDIVKKPPLSPAKHRPAQAPPKIQSTPPLAPVKRPSNATRAAKVKPPVTITLSEPVETSSYPLWETGVVSGIPKGAWYGD